ncbi:unnamed protein product [Pleuronectes platessa]|uniref:Uncharacterized protein n=1 Tax=Pleuronectes platessa TaxID=8262 RepID=A0A9N7UI38_PLEPL|nr:unnamed protein product [Pleuronectes platessa]
MLNRQNSLRAVEGLTAWLRQAVLWVPAAANLCNPPPSLHKFIQRTGVSEGQEGFSILPKETSAGRWVGLGIEPLTFGLEDDHSTPQPHP